MKMISKIDFRWIIIDHIRTLRNYETKNISKGDLFLFFGVPLITSFLLLYFKLILSKDVVNILSVSLSVFTALLLNLLLLVYNIVRRPEFNSRKTVFKDLLKEIFSNISFAILTAILTLIILVVVLVESNLLKSYLCMFLVYYLSSLFVLTLLLILKRVHVLLSKEFE